MLHTLPLDARETDASGIEKEEDRMRGLYVEEGLLRVLECTCTPGHGKNMKKQSGIYKKENKERKRET